LDVRRYNALLCAVAVVLLGGCGTERAGRGGVSHGDRADPVGKGALLGHRRPDRRRRPFAEPETAHLARRDPASRLGAGEPFKKEAALAKHRAATGVGLA
jgi:hypothetical protein